MTMLGQPPSLSIQRKDGLSYPGSKSVIGQLRCIATLQNKLHKFSFTNKHASPGQKYPYPSSIHPLPYKRSKKFSSTFLLTQRKDNLRNPGSRGVINQLRCVATLQNKPHNFIFANKYASPGQKYSYPYSIYHSLIKSQKKFIDTFFDLAQRRFKLPRV